MFRTIHRNIRQYIIAGILLAFIAPALPARAADDSVSNTNASVDTTASQTATSGDAVNSGNGQIPEVPPFTPVTPVDTTPPVIPPVCPVMPVTPVSQNPTTTTNASINNCINSGASTGNAAVSNNGTAGNATSGDADAAATILNLIQSTNGLGAGGLASFTDDINDLNGNYNIDPSMLVLLAAQNQACGCNALMQAYLNASINNNVNLNANSGNASVTGNGSAGDATTGNANAMANIVNIINSITNASQAFVGVINIYGTLNGDILLPEGWYDSLLASQGQGSCSSNCGNSGTSDSDMAIINNINLTAITGNASVTNNGQAGDALTGDAATKLNIINLINRQIVGGNVLLVFVNVLGHWVGLLMNAPAGSTTATLGGNIDQDTSSCGCQGGSSNLNAQITNNINLTATSGNALVNANGSAGNATTGDATASLNLVNIINSQFSLSGWLGILFINVFGTWNGNLASAQAPVEILMVVVPKNNGSTVPVTAKPVKTPKAVNNSSELDDTQEQPQVLGSLLSDDTNPPVSDQATSDLMKLLGAGGLFCCALLGAVDRRKSKKNVTTFDNIAI